jgi:hypothetical protein
VALVSIPPHKSLRQPCWYYWLHETEYYYFRAVPGSMCPCQISSKSVSSSRAESCGQTNMTSPIYVNSVQETHRKENRLFTAALAWRGVLVYEINGGINCVLHCQAILNDVSHPSRATRSQMYVTSCGCKSLFSVGYIYSVMSVSIVCAFERLSIQGVVVVLQN